MPIKDPRSFTCKHSWIGYKPVPFCNPDSLCRLGCGSTISEVQFDTYIKRQETARRHEIEESTRPDKYSRT
jgi:hypothetical protein